MTLSAADILGPTGRIAARLSNYEHRPQQLEMAEAVARAIGEKKHLVAEAGTGVGKSFAYLVPAILAATELQAERGPTGGNGTAPPPGPKIVVSTHTISLQEQLINKDLPLLNAVIPREFSAVLVKGRRNYLSLRRLDLALSRSRSLFSDEEQLAQLRDVNKWSKSSHDGSLSDLSFRPLGPVWDEVASDSTNCLGRRCPTHGKCFYYQDRRRMQNAQILVVNHALLFSDIALRRVGVSILPDYDIVILDEAHTVESVAGDHLGIKVTSGSVDYVLNKLYNDRSNKGLLVHHGLAREQQQVDRCRHQADMFFGDLFEWRAQHAAKNGRVSEAGIVANHLSADLETLARQLKTAGGKLREESEQQDFIASHDRLMGLAGEIEMWRMQAQAGAVYWIESNYSRRGTPRLTLSAAPVDIGPAMREQLFDKVPTVILTSATLSVGGSTGERSSPASSSPNSRRPTDAGPGRGFEFFQSRIGLTQCQSAQVGSPFNFREQAELVTLRDMPDPASARDAFEKRCVPLIQEYAGRTDGRTFVLFTSYDMLRRMAAALAAVARLAQPAPLEPGRRHAAHPDARRVQARSAGGAPRYRQFLARRRRAGRRAANRDHRQAPIRRARPPSARSSARSNPSRRRQPVPRLPTAGSRDQIQTRLRPPDPHPHRPRHRGLP